MSPEIERRALKGSEVRAAEGERKIVGYAAVFNSLSEDLGGFREVILPGAFDRAIREGHDAVALWNHDSSEVLGRVSAGTLALSVDEHGLRSEITPPASAENRMETIRRGDVKAMSFGFRVLTDAWRTQDGDQVRELVDLELLDVSPVAYPAYPATQVSTRALERAREKPALVPEGIPAENIRLRRRER